MNNHNHLLGRIAGVDGLKTGFTSGAGFCLSATAERNGHRIIVVMMDSPDSRTRDLNVQQLITQAFMKVPIAEAPFGSLQETPVPAATVPVLPTSPTRPVDNGPVIHLPGPSR